MRVTAAYIRQEMQVFRASMRDHRNPPSLVDGVLLFIRDLAAKATYANPEEQLNMANAIDSLQAQWDHTKAHRAALRPLTEFAA